MTVEELLARAQEGIHAGRSFGPVIERDGCSIVPVALTVAGGGAGDSPRDTESITGGGFGMVSWPLGVYVVRDDSAKWVPAVDATLVALGLIGLLRAAIRLLTRRRST